MRRIVLPGYGTATTFSPTEDSTITIDTGNRHIPITLKAGQVTRIEFLNSMQVAA